MQVFVLFIYGLFNDAVSASNCTASNRYCTDICLAGLRKTTNILSVESRSPGRDYQNTKQENAGGRYFDTERRDWLRV